MEAEERPAKIPRLDPAAGTESAPSLPPDTSIAASIPGLPRSEAEGTHATSLEESGPSLNASDAAAAKADASTDGSLAHLSKSARKKLLKRQAWEAAKPARKAFKKERLAKRKEQARTARAEVRAAGPDAASLQAIPNPSRGVRSKRAAAYTPLPVGIVLDCAFDELMTEKEVISLSSQITRCYSENAKAAPAHTRLVVAGLDGRLKERYETVLENTHLNWRSIEMRTEGLPEVIQNLAFHTDSARVAASSALGKAATTTPPTESTTSAKTWTTDLTDPPSLNADGTIPVQRTVYLSADADETLTELKPYETYVVGALVDRNRHKGICRKRADELGIPTAKLPIGEYLRMASRQVLATNHVVEIMLYWLQGMGWANALEQVIPKRKGAVLKGQGQDGDEEGSGREGEHVSVAEATTDPPVPDEDHHVSTTAT